MKEYDEEVRCFELAFRRYTHHPLLPILQEQIAIRLQESAREARKAAYDFASIVLRFLPDVAKMTSSKKLFANMQRDWEKAYFMKSLDTNLDADLQNHAFSITLAFWLAKPYVLIDEITLLLQMPKIPIQLVEDALFALIELGAFAQAQEKIAAIRALLSDAEKERLLKTFHLLDKAIEVEAAP